MKRNITKQLLHVCGSVQDSDSIRAGTARVGNSETCVRCSYQFQVFKLFHITAQVLFRQGGNVVVS